MTIKTNARIPPGDWVLVTGANGYLASHITNILLQLGYKVRGSVRSQSEAPWIQGYFDSKFGEGKFELAIITDLTDAEGFETATEGMSGVIHSASILPSSSDVNAVVTPVVAGTRNALDAALKQNTVKAFVVTSSSTAACFPEFVKPNVVVNENSWNEEAVSAAYSAATPAKDMPLMVYAASKTLAERELWDWVKREKPTFTATAVLPNFNMGPPLTSDVTTGSWPHVRSLLNGDEPWYDVIAPQYFIDVRDNARLHIAALLGQNVRSERVFGFAEKFNWTLIIKIMRGLRPDNKHIPDPRPGEPFDLTDAVEVSERSLELLQYHFGVSGWTSLVDSITQGIKDIN